MKLFKLIFLALIASVFLNFLVYYSGYATNNILFSSDKNFVSKSVWFILAISFFIFFHSLFIAVKKNTLQTLAYYTFLTTTIITNILIYQPIGIYVSLLDGGLVLIGLTLIHFKFTNEFNNLINPNLQIAHNIVTMFLLFLALTISLNFYILNTSQKESLMQQIQNFITQTTTNLVEKYSKNTFLDESKTISPQTIIIANQKIELPKINVDQSQIKGQAVEQVSRQIENYIAPYEGYIVTGASVLVFITILSIGFLIHMILTILNYSLFNILRLAKFVNFETEMVEARRLRL